MYAMLDETIRTCYMTFGTPADQILVDPGVAGEFADLVNSNVPPGRPGFNVAAINRRLLTLRKRGEEKGGLARLERAYSGRTSRS